MCWTTKELWFDSQQRQVTFLLTKTCGLALVATQPPVHSHHSPPFSARVKMSGAVPPLPNIPAWPAEGQLHFLTYLVIWLYILLWKDGCDLRLCGTPAQTLERNGTVRNSEQFLVWGQDLAAALEAPPLLGFPPHHFLLQVDVSHLVWPLRAVSAACCSFHQW